jgi:hypothetical protein
VKRGAKQVVTKAPRQLPEPLEAASADLLSSAERFARTIDQIAKQILGLQFDPARFGPPAFASMQKASVRDTSVQDTSVQRRAVTEATLSRDASTLYFALTLAVDALGLTHLLVSETRTAQLIAEQAAANWPDENLDSGARCAALYRQIVACHPLEDAPGTTGRHPTERRDHIRKVAFATSLWVYLERGDFDDSETELVTLCCDVAAQRADPLRAAENDEAKLRALFSYALSIV